MTSPSRLQRAFARHGVALQRDGAVYHVRRADRQARILLPADLPLEAKAVTQLLDFAGVGWPDRPDPVRCACATPDFHPGSLAPVGSIVATDPDVVIPAAIGTDIYCGMRLITTGLRQDELLAHEPRIVEHLTRRLLVGETDVPVPAIAFRALFERGPQDCLEALAAEGIWASADRDRLHREVAACVGLDGLGGKVEYAPDHLVAGRDRVRAPDLGTVGSGNHFVEFQTVDAVLDRRIAYSAGLRLGDVVVMIHSGSRGVGFHVGRRWMDRARHRWPAGHAHPESGLYALRGDDAAECLEAMGTAARYAWLNRVVIAEWVREALESCVGAGGSRLVVDVPHNFVSAEHGMHLHRKGSTPARAGEWALLPGSMGDASYLVEGLGHPDWLWSCSHGAGRAVRRQVIRREAKDAASSSWRCVTLREERRLQEHPSAYKPIGPVLNCQEEAGLLRAAVKLKPWLTFKA
ncbi:MAG TPA: RtcB family protein [Tahibacter sp.]|uniref:RtcB family protein n=1 Tax=Tahibacter sp. TaxID=2056211 RepID=UPI002C3425B6|nr:RtcB family protein [Tahibacter sp.]HSX62291.1 RtcB family protein [Tahibacter sp.]